MQSSLEQIQDEKKAVYRVQGFTCTDCAAKFEKNVKALPEVNNASVNFGASKLTVYGKATIQDLEKAGAFEGLKIYPEKEKARQSIRSLMNVAPKRRRFAAAILKCRSASMSGMMNMMENENMGKMMDAMNSPSSKKHQQTDNTEKILRKTDNPSLEINAKNQAILQAECTLPGHKEAGMIANVIVGE